MKKVTFETEKGDMLCAAASEVEKGSTELRKTKTVCKTSWSSRQRLQGVHKMLGPAQRSMRSRMQTGWRLQRRQQPQCDPTRQVAQK